MGNRSWRSSYSAESVASRICHRGLVGGSGLGEILWIQTSVGLGLGVEHRLSTCAGQGRVRRRAKGAGRGLREHSVDHQGALTPHPLPPTPVGPATETGWTDVEPRVRSKEFAAARLLQIEPVGEGGQVLEVAANRVQTQTHGDHGDMGATGFAPGIDLPREFASVGSAERDVVATKGFG